jgi:uncharacterized membrane-anchored protein
LVRDRPGFDDRSYRTGATCPKPSTTRHVRHRKALQGFRASLLSGTSIVMGALLLIVLLAQIRSRRYIPWLYWPTVVFVSVVGTLITDNLTDSLGVSLFVSTAAFSIALAATFAIWYVSERTLSIQAITTRKRELFYWAAILLTFALGTAAGDLTAEHFQIGYGPSALVFGAMIAAVTAAHYLLGADAILAFWIAYILTRPLGASIGDYLSQDRDEGGLALGTVTTSAFFLLTILALVAYLTVTRRDQIEITELRSST